MGDKIRFNATGDRVHVESSYLQDEFFVKRQLDIMIHTIRGNITQLIELQSLLDVHGYKNTSTIKKKLTVGCKARCIHVSMDLKKYRTTTQLVQPSLTFGVFMETHGRKLRNDETLCNEIMKEVFDFGCLMRGDKERVTRCMIEFHKRKLQAYGDTEIRGDKQQD